MQIIIPQKVGIAKDMNIHFKLEVSFFIVIKVVVHGKCKHVKIITLIAVSKFQPFCINIWAISKLLSILQRAVPFK